MSKKFAASEIPSLDGKVAIVTGGNGGIGLETVRQLALHGAKVYMASRTESKAQAAIEELKKEKPLDIHFLHIDLMKIESAKTCAKDFLSKESKLDILVNNAGVMAVDYKLTDDGIDQTFQVNYLTHFALFKHLKDVLEKTGRENGHPARVINLSSFAHNFITWNPLLSPDFTSKEAVNRKMGFGQTGKYMRYSQAKLSALLFSRELNKRYPKGEIRSSGVHPGFVASNLYKDTPFSSFAPRIFITTADGALASLFAATSKEIEEKNTWDVYRGEFAMPQHDTSYSKDEKLQKDLWELSERLTDNHV